MKVHVRLLTLVVLALTTLLPGCGGKSAPKPQPQGKPIDPSGNWKLVMTDTNSNTFLLSALFSQTGSDVTALNISEVGNTATFQCATQTDVSLANGTVQNISTFSGDLSGNFGTIHFTSTLNDAGSHAGGTYTLTPPQSGNCSGVATTGTFTADEIPSMSGSWTGTVTCSVNCPTASPAGTSGTITVTLTQNDTTGAVAGTYTVTGLLPLLSSGAISTNTSTSDLLSGASWQDTLTDNTGSILAVAGGPLSSNGTAGLGLDKSFQGILILKSCCSDTRYTVAMGH